MKKLSYVLAMMVAICLSSCGFNMQPTLNHNLSQTQVLLQNDEFKIIGKASGEASATYILGIGGLSQKAIYNNAIADMFNKTNLSGSQTIVHINVHQHIGGVPPFYVKARYFASGIIVEFNNPEKINLPQTEDAKIAAKPIETKPIETKPIETKTIEAEPIVAKTIDDKYSIGDAYRIGSRVAGIVVSVSEDGKHGKIISLNQAHLTWSGTDTYFNASSKNNGLSNTMAIPPHANTPAINWCIKLNGAHWYLPSVAEMQDVYKNLKTINNSLKSHGGKEIAEYELYWTSTERSKTEAVAVQSTYYLISLKSEAALVIAMAEF